MANGQENLIPFTERTEEEQREIAKQGGKASGEARRKKKKLREELEIILEMADSSDKTTQEKICLALIKKASEGDTKAFEIIRDTIGQKPVENYNVTETPRILDDIE